MKKKCDFCRGAKYISGVFSASGPMPDGGSFCSQMDGDVNYCPICGRSLMEDTSFRIPSKDEWMERYCTPKQYAGYQKREGNKNDTTTV